jgi:hypothetical protein
LLLCGVAIGAVIARRRAAAGALDLGRLDSPIGPDARTTRKTPSVYARSPRA